MNEELKIGDVVTFCKKPEHFMHNALVVEIGSNGMIHLVHMNTYRDTSLRDRSLPQVELNVPWQKADADGRYYFVEPKS